MIIGPCAGLRKQGAECVVIVGIGDRGGRVGEEADRAMAVIAIEAGSGRAADRLSFVTYGHRVGSGDCRALEFIFSRLG